MSFKTQVFYNIDFNFKEFNKVIFDISGYCSQYIDKKSNTDIYKCCLYTSTFSEN